MALALILTLALHRCAVIDRQHYIDALELSQQTGGHESRAALLRLLPTRFSICGQETDHYGRKV
jgi:hypothetical protein